MTKSLKRITAEGTLWTSGSTLVVKVLGLASVFFILRALSAEQYGILELTLSIPVLLSIFLLPGLDSLVLADMGAEYGRGERRRARSILTSFMRLQILLAFAAWAITFFGAAIFTHLYPVSVSYIQAASFLFLIGPLRTAYATVFRVQLKFFALSSISFLEEFFKLSMLLLVFFFFELSIVWVIVIMATSQLLVLGVLALPFIRGWMEMTGGGMSEPIPSFQLLQGRGAWSVLSVYAGNVGKAARLWVIQRILGAEAVGLYAVASGLMGHTMALAPIHAVVAPILPQFSHDPSRFARIFSKSIKYQLLSYCAIGVVGFFAFPPILSWLFPDYASAMPLFQIMLLGLIPIAFLSVITPAFAALKLQKSFFASVLIKDVVSIVLTYILATLFGLPGVAYEYVLSTSIYVFERLRRLQRHMKEISVLRTQIFSFDDDDRLILGKVSSFVGRILKYE